jgi:molybdopterin converting factor small subunit
MADEINIILFGQLAQLAGKDRIMLSGMNDTLQLREEVNELFPALQNIDYAIAVEKKIIHENAMVADGQTVALLPPFSGG